MKFDDSLTRADNNFNSVTQCSVLAGPKLFEMLSAKLYSEPLVAVARELAANSLDAHVAAGNEKTPIDITLPHTFNSEFRIRDYGTGMTEERLVSVWGMWLNSDKNNDDDAIGGWGIGGKVGYHVADAFTIKSYVAGELKTYTAFKNDQNIPSIARLNVERTEEPDGLEIIIPIQRSRVAEFVAATHKGLRFFPEGSYRFTNPDIEPQPVEYSYKGKLFGYSKDSYYGCTIVMGPIGYSLNVALIEDYLVEHCSLGKNFPYRQLFDLSSMHIFVPMGSVMPHPNREQLEYNKQTKETINYLLPHIVEEIEKQFIGDLSIDNFDCEYDFYLRVKTVLSNLPPHLQNTLSDTSKITQQIRAKFNTTSASFVRQAGGFFTTYSDDMPSIYRLSDATDRILPWVPHITNEFTRCLENDNVKLLCVWIPRVQKYIAGEARAIISGRIWKAFCEDGSYSSIHVFLMYGDQESRRCMKRVYGDNVTHVELESLPQIDLDEIPKNLLPSAINKAKPYAVTTGSKPVELLKLKPIQYDNTARHNISTISSDQLDEITQPICYIFTERRQPIDNHKTAMYKVWRLQSILSDRVKDTPLHNKLHPVIIGVQSSLTKRDKRAVTDNFPDVETYYKDLCREIREEGWLWEEVYINHRLHHLNINLGLIRVFDEKLGRYLRRHFDYTPLYKLIESYAWRAYPKRPPYPVIYEDHLPWFESVMDHSEFVDVVLTPERREQLDREVTHISEEIETIARYYGLLFSHLPLTSSRYYANNEVIDKQLRRYIVQFIRTLHPTSFYDRIPSHKGE